MAEGRDGPAAVAGHEEVIDDRERLHSFVKADLREFTIAKTSPMPSATGTLSDAEIADMLAFLLTLKGQLP